MESVAGVAAGAFVLALLENAVGAHTTIPTSFQDALSFTLLVVALVALPQGLPGLFGRIASRFRRVA
jgi:branched-subunit amino acid ABC-type transport system permease component